MDLREISVLTVALRVVLAISIGGLLGIERGQRNRPAGFRTYTLVCLGAALVMMTNQYVFQMYSVSDPVRMGAQVVSGVGFLGAGTILITSRNQVKGITTAAGLWTAACSGLAVGIGFYEGAIIGALAILVVMTAFRKLDGRIHQKSLLIELYIELAPEAPLSRFIDYAHENAFEITDLQMNKQGLSGAGMAATLVAKSKIKRTHADMIGVLGGAPGVQYLFEI